MALAQELKGSSWQRTCAWTSKDPGESRKPSLNFKFIRSKFDDYDDQVVSPLTRHHDDFGDGLKLPVVVEQAEQLVR